MFSPTRFRDLVSGRRRGPAAALLRGLLRLGEVPYTAAMRWRNYRFDQAHGRIERVPVPVISVGNLTLGGTGKTPLVEWLARWLTEQGVRVAVVSRGYGAPPGAQNDEALELAEKLPGVPHVQNSDRAAAARQAIKRYHCQVILLDDGFQHRRLARDLDIVLLDALEPWGFGHVFPRGMLREPPAGLARAGVLALSRADLADELQRGALRDEALARAPGAAWCELEHRPQCLLDCRGNRAAVETLAGRPVAAFCGIGNPEAFRRTLLRCNYRVQRFREFPDHYPYRDEDIDSLAAWVNEAGVEAVVCTHKDLVKIGRPQMAGRPLWAVRIAVEVTTGLEALTDRLGNLLLRVPA